MIGRTCPEAPDLPLSELADNHANGNARYGHIALLATGEARADAWFEDSGPWLKFNAQHGGLMTPAAVRALAHELLAWADRKEQAEADECKTRRA